MSAQEEIGYRLRLAEGFRDEARQDLDLSRWRSCVDNSQLATENAAKAALALLGPVGRTHDPAAVLQIALADGRFPAAEAVHVGRLIECARELGPAVHIESDYGDEQNRLTPWELFDETAAREAFGFAEAAFALARQITSSGPVP
jgi:HEPN domain-containing protein